ncbi:kinase-like protein [Auriscalpium vulgare]|uniref:Kinase-like protein n=1 Tax=Auriscalpium vulgare TaxID=40419 RepID=A0ACB8S8V1_9AGAM|nr:kinase-like protein [Auriscalpium vulgare]
MPGLLVSPPLRITRKTGKLLQTLPRPPGVQLAARSLESWDDDEIFNPHYHSNQPPPVEDRNKGAGEVPMDDSFPPSNRFPFQDLLYCVKFANPADLARALAEVRALRRISEHKLSPFLVEASYYLEGPQPFYAVPTLRRSLRSEVGYPKNLPQYMYQTTKGLASLHDIGIIHRDIRPDNLLLTEDGDICIANFDLAYVHSKRHMRLCNLNLSDFPVGLLEYRSPEARRGSYNHMVDYWALGITMFELYCGQLPLGATDADKVDGIGSDDWREGDRLPESERRVMRAFLNPQPLVRAGATSDPYFNRVKK